MNKINLFKSDTESEPELLSILDKELEFPF